MPKELEEKLEREANSKGLTGSRKNAYIYGTLRKMGWKPKGQRKSRRDVGIYP